MGAPRRRSPSRSRKPNRRTPRLQPGEGEPRQQRRRRDGLYRYRAAEEPDAGEIAARRRLNGLD